MVSDQEIANGVESLLRQSNPNAVNSINGVVQQLEAKLGLDLSHKAGFIRDQIDRLLRAHTRPLPPKDHFTLENHPQFQNHHPQIPPHFAFPHRPEELNFGYPHQPQPQHHPHPHQQSHSHSQSHAHPNPHAQLQQQQQQQQTHTHVQPQKAADVFAPNVAAATTAETPKESAPTGTKRRGGPGGLNKVCGVSPELQAIVGEPALPRTQIVKQLWAYIRKNNLQDPSNKRKIICNDELRLVFETDCTDMFKMNKLLAKHIIPLQPSKESGQDSKRLKVEMESASESTDPGSSPVIITDALARFFGTGEREMLQSEVVKRVWEYIKINHLEDPINSMMVICDPKLQELFGCNSISTLAISQMLLSHFFKQS